MREVAEVLGAEVLGAAGVTVAEVPALATTGPSGCHLISLGESIPSTNGLNSVSSLQGQGWLLKHNIIKLMVPIRNQCSNQIQDESPSLYLPYYTFLLPLRLLSPLKQICLTL